MLSFDNIENEDENIIRLNVHKMYNTEAPVILYNDVCLNDNRQPSQLIKKRSSNRPSRKNQCSPLCSQVKKNLKSKILKLQKILKNKNAQLSRWKSKYSKLEESKITSVDDFLDKFNVTKPFARTMVKLQVHKPNTPYSQDQKELAKHIFYHSSSGYTRLRSSGLILPAEATVLRYLNTPLILALMINFLIY